MSDVPMSFWTRMLIFIGLAKRFYAVSCDHEKLTAVMRQAVCDFQLSHALYHQEISLGHQLFKESWMRYLDEKITGGFESGEEYDLVESYENLKDIANGKLKMLCAATSENIKNYFSESRPCNADSCRVGIYVFLENDRLLNLAYESESKDPAGYTIFKEVIKGKPYLDNNIPMTFKRKGYVDVGIDNDKADDYQRHWKVKWWTRFRRSKKVKECRKWSLCAKEQNRDSPLPRSHIAVPITFIGHINKGRLEEASVPALGEKVEGKISRAILGVLVVDYPEPFFFDHTDPNASQYENVDVNVLYQFADLISLDILLNRKYFHNSTTVRGYRQILEQRLTTGGI